MRDESDDESAFDHREALRALHEHESGIARRSPRSPSRSRRRRRRGGELEFEPLVRADLPEGRSLQSWTKGDDWPGPASLGLVRPGEPRRVASARLPPLRANPLFEIALEPHDGSPTGRPTGSIRYIGRAVPTM